MLGLTIETEFLGDETRVVSVAGELDMYTAPQFEQRLVEAFDSGAGRVIVDLSRCEFLDSCALGVLITARKRLDQEKERLVLVASDRNIVKVFEITGLDRMFTIAPTRATALNEQPVPDWRDEEARKRGLFREVNEQIRSLGAAFTVNGRTPFVCECGNAGCTRAIEVSRAEYEAVRAQGRRYIVASDHENPEIEVIVEENNHFAVVETLVGDASRIAEETDPRAGVAAG